MSAAARSRLRAPAPAKVAVAAGVNRISARFAELRLRGRKAFIAYLCAGDPDLDATVELVVAMAERTDERERVDIIELGIPYSDPMADGPANQAACERALRSGTTVAGVLKAVRRIRARTQVPLLFFTYLNPILAYGIERFAAEAAASGVDGVLPLDLPPEEGPGLRATLQAAGLATVCLSAPTTPAARRLMLMRASGGFLYYVCRLGVTGERAELPKDLARQVAALKRVADTPVCIGFGISSPEQAMMAAEIGDGVIVGSHLVRLVEAHGRDARLVELVAGRAGVLAAAVHRVGG
jgi:tryptophan synthase alpha chain